MNLTEELELPEVAKQVKKGRFYKDTDGRELIEISFVGSKDTFVSAVEPEHMAEFRSEWNAYCDGRPPERRKGTALTDLPGLEPQKAEKYINANVHTLEELAALSDGQCQAVGHGVLTDRENTRKLLLDRQHKFKELMQKRVGDAMAKAQPVKDEAATAELSEMKTAIAALAQGQAETNKSIAALVQALTPRKPGRPPKAEPE